MMTRTESVPPRSLVYRSALIVALGSFGCSNGGPESDQIETVRSALTGPQCSSAGADGCWTRPDGANYTAFDFGWSMACAIQAGSLGPNGPSCDNNTQCPKNTFTNGCNFNVNRCEQFDASVIRCWNQNWDPLIVATPLPQKIQSVAVVSRGNGIRAVAALTSDSVVHIATGTASTNLATFNGGFKTWTPLAAVDTNNQPICLKKIAAITLPSLGVDSQLLALSCSNQLYARQMNTNAGTWAVATTMAPWNAFATGSAFFDISHYNSEGGASLLGGDGRVYRVGQATVTSTGVRTWKAVVQLPVLPGGAAVVAVGGSHVIASGSQPIFYSDQKSGGWQAFTGGTPFNANPDVSKLIVDATSFRLRDRDFAVFQSNFRMYQWQAPIYASGVFMDQNWNTQTDWDFGFYKGTCSQGSVQMGISSSLSGTGNHKVLCRAAGPQEVSRGAQPTATLAGASDQRRGNRPDAFGRSDWDPGFVKLECGVNEFVSGSSQTPGGTRAFHGVRCSGPSGFTDNLCFTKNVDAQDDRFTLDSNDWDSGFFKGECGLNSYIAGVSVSPTTQHVHSIFCCQRSAGPTF